MKDGETKQNEHAPARRVRNGELPCALSRGGGIMKKGKSSEPSYNILKR